jgi:DNA-binding NarL/FixJ family response regulator
MTGMEEKRQAKQQIRVLIADDHRSARRGLKVLLDLFPQVEVVGEAADGQEAVDLAAERRPDVVLMDVKMPVLDGLEATRRIKSRWPDVRVVALTMDARYRTRALTAGADVFLLKEGTGDALQAAITEERTGPTLIIRSDCEMDNREKKEGRKSNE